jgi:putative flippase GtrA
VTPSISRFLKYASIGFSTFGLDLLLLLVFTSILNLNYILSAGIAFVLAITVNYLFSRRYVFYGTLRSARTGYFGFLLIASGGFLFVTGLMYVCVGRLGLNLYLSRVIVAGLVGIWNYVMNLYVNFKVTEKL